MCGLVGYGSVSRAGDVSLLDAQAARLDHRGPDDAGAFWSEDRRVGLAHRRLAILDLSAAGRQPMRDERRGTHIVYNGEIYNHEELRRELGRRGEVFETRTDTEVVLRAYAVWGEACVDHFVGMFAFAIHDTGERCLVLARDRVGEKPLFYHHAAGTLRFASELKALLLDPVVSRVADPQALDHYLAFGYTPSDRSLIAGVRKLEPGCRLRFDLDSGELRVQRYWALPVPGPRADIGIDDAVDELEALLRDSVRGQLVADVPVGILLSGGLDSSLVTAIAAQVSTAPVKTFTISFPGSRTHDEGPFARAVAAHCGTEHHELAAEHASVELLADLARHYDDPIADSSMVPTYLVSRLVRGEATVALSGDGGDELFGGYPHYSWLLQLEQIRRFAPRPVRVAVASAGAALPYGTRGRNHFIGMAGTTRSSIGHVNLFFDRQTRRRLVPALYADGTSPDAEARKERLCEPGATTLQAATAADFGSYLADDILVKVDRASMLASLEVRAPFLDHRIVELAFGRLPDQLRATGRRRKIVLQALAKRLLPPGFDTTRKQGFMLPLDQWFKGTWGRFFGRQLAGEALPGFDRGLIGELFRAQQQGRRNTQRLFALCMLELWRRAYDVTLTSHERGRTTGRVAGTGASTANRIAQP